jgi:hypothetical protein
VILKLFFKKIVSKCCKWEKRGYNIKAVLRNTVVDQYNLNLINYNAIFAERVEPIVIDELYDLNLLIEDSLDFTKTATCAVTHYIIDSLCQYIIENKARVEQPVFVVCPKCINRGELNRYIAEKTDLSAFVLKQFNKLKNILGIKSITYNEEFDILTERVKSRDGDVIELLSSVDTSTPRDLYKLYKFVDKLGLKGIKQKFFEDQQYKQVFI